MNVVYILNHPKAVALKNSMEKLIDSINFYMYPTIGEFVHDVSHRKYQISRVILTGSSSGSLGESDLKVLQDYISSNSSSTEVVLLVPEKSVESSKEMFPVFNSMFTMPTCTIALISQPNSKNLVAIATESISSLHSRYGESTKIDNLENYSESAEKISLEENTSQVVENLSEDTLSKSGDFLSGPASISLEKPIKDKSTEVEGLSEDLEFGSTFSNVPTPLGVASLSSEDLSMDDDDIDLSIGDLGKSHSDTGFLDEEDEAELKAFAESRDTSNEVPKVESSPSPSEETIEVPISSNISSLPNMDIVIAVRGNGSTQAIIDEAVKIVNTDGAEVLIIDLDNKENGILSYIDVDKFYRENAQEGISKQRVYKEDGVSIVSNGYGCPVSGVELKNFIMGRIPKKYDMIYLDCPTDSLNILNKELIDMFNVLVYCTGERDDLVATSLALTDRRVVSLSVEREIMSKCMVELVNVNNEDVSFVDRVCLFANGNWLNNFEG